MSTRLAQTPAEGVCLRCRAAGVPDPRIDPAVARVVGDERGNVRACKRCGETSDGRPIGSTTAAAVQARASGVGVGGWSR